MCPETVNAYLALLGDLLQEGVLQHVNNREARHIPGNAIALYDYSKIGIPSFSEVRYHTRLSSGSPIISTHVAQQT